MDSNTRLRNFMKEVLKVTPAYNDVAQSLPGFGVANPGADVTDEMRKTAAEFAHAYNDPKAARGALQDLADRLEGQLHTVGTLVVGAEDRTLSLVDDLQSLMETRA